MVCRSVWFEWAVRHSAQNIFKKEEKKNTKKKEKNLEKKIKSAKKQSHTVPLCCWAANSTLYGVRRITDFQMRPTHENSSEYIVNTSSQQIINKQWNRFDDNSDFDNDNDDDGEQNISHRETKTSHTTIIHHRQSGRYVLHIALYYIYMHLPLPEWIILHN